MKGFQISVISLIIAILAIWIWLMSHGIPFERSPAKLSVLIAGMLAGGVYTMLVAIFNWNWFFEQEKVKSIVKRLGRTGARIFYFLMGLGLVWFGQYGAKILLITGFLNKAKQ